METLAKPSSGQTRETLNESNCVALQVFVELHGENGNSGRQVLEKKSGEAEPFQRGAKDRFKISWPELGRLREVSLGTRG